MTPADVVFKPFVCSDDPGHHALTLLVNDFPDRWHSEGFFRNDAHLAWHRAATHKFNIRFNHMAQDLAQRLLACIDGAMRVERDTIIVTLYHAPFNAATAEFYRNLPQALTHMNADPHIPWLFNYTLALRFK